MANPSSLSGQRLGAYEVGPLIGAGGMGEVYRAHDSKLNRNVAIKVLLPAVANDAERLARFRHEAQTLASLNHPGIAQIHGLEEGSAGPFLVMELVDGPTLADRIAQGPLPVDETLAIARQLVDALDAAHERGIIHRDLKPANIKVCDDGSVKILDFGLAKAMDPQSGVGAAGSVANSPTITSPAMTQAGLILGTAAYMSPEQAKGRVVDKRTDVWAFGCVLYEMLTGRRAFDGEDVTDTIAAVVRGEPNWSALPKDTPQQIRLLLKRCLDKDRRTRISDVSVARFLLNERVESDASPETPPDGRSRSARWPLAAAAVLGLIFGGVAVVVAGWALAPPPTPSTARFVFTPPAAQPITIQGNDRDIAMAPDGSFLVYRSADGRAPVQLVVRAMNELEGRPLAGSGGARSPAISPDGRWVAFAAQNELRKVPVAGGAPTTVCRLEGALRGISWGDDGHIVFATTLGDGLRRVPADGGEPQTITKPDRGTQHLQPFVAPGSQVVVFTASTGSVLTSTVEGIDLSNGRQQTLVNSAHDPAYIHDGVLVYTTTTQTTSDERQNSSLRAVRFDPRRLAVEGDSVLALDQLVIMPTGAASYTVSSRGDLVYIPTATLGSAVRRELVWVDRRGQETPIAAPPRAYAVARISPDGSKVALDVRDQTNDIWILDLNRQTSTPLNRDPAQDLSPIWTPEGRRIIWTSTRGGTTPNLYWQLANGTGPIERLSTNPGNQFPTSITPDGTQLILFGSNLSQQMDLFRIDLGDKDRKPQILVSSPLLDVGGELSPDGRWLAYQSNESGEHQVYVRPFPNVQDDRSQISTDGGTRPAWSRRGDELFYLDRRGSLTAVKVTSAAKSLTAGAPSTLLSTPYYPGSSILGLDLRAYDVAPDAKRFLMIKDIDRAEAQASQTSMVVVLHWAEELKPRLAAR